MAQSKATARWNKENIVTIGCSVSIKSGIPDALQAAITAQGVTKNAYTVEALRQRLVKEGYLQRTLPGDSELNRE